MTSLACTCASLRQASRFLSRIYDEALAPAGLGINQYSILARLGRHGPSRQQDLARSLVMDRSTLGHLLRPLLARDLVIVNRTCDDARCRVVALTDGGRACLEAARPLWLDAQRRFEAAFGADDSRDLRTMLGRLVSLEHDAFASPAASLPKGLEP